MRNRRNVTEFEKSEWVRLRRQGLSYDVIAHRFARSTGTVQGYVSRHYPELRGKNSHRDHGTHHALQECWADRPKKDYSDLKLPVRTDSDLIRPIFKERLMAGR